MDCKGFALLKANYVVIIPKQEVGAENKYLIYSKFLVWLR